MIIEIKIPIEDLFSQVIEQSLYDYKSEVEGTTIVAENLALSKEEINIFDINLLTAMNELASDMLGYIREYYTDNNNLRVEIEVKGRATPQTIAMRIKDCLKYAMLEWWHEPRAPHLANGYYQKRSLMSSNLKTQLVGANIKRPYNL